MLDLKKQEYKGYFIYYYENKYLKYGQKYIDGEFLTKDIYKNTLRNYVAKIEIEKNKFIIKSPKSETILPQKKIMGILKKGEALTTLINLNKNIEEGFYEFVQPYLAIIKKDIFLKESFILMENIDGKEINNLENSKIEIDKILSVIKKMHNKKIYHGDLNTSNFISYNSEIKIIDTQGKKDIFSNYKRAYDYLTLKEDLLVLKINYKVNEKYRINKKTIGYLLAYIVKNFKKNRLIKQIRNFKKKLRKKGWRI